MMFVVVNLHRQLVNVRLKRVERVLRKRWYDEGHRTPSLGEVACCAIKKSSLSFQNPTQGIRCQGEVSGHRAQVACSAMTASAEAASAARRWRRRVLSGVCGAVRAARALPAAMQALRWRPRLLARRTALPRKVRRNCCSSSERSQRSSGASRFSRGCTAGRFVGGAVRFQGADDPGRCRSRKLASPWLRETLRGCCPAARWSGRRCSGGRRGRRGSTKRAGGAGVEAEAAIAAGVGRRRANAVGRGR